MQESYGEQVYEQRGDWEYQKRDGSMVTLTDWASNCPDCGAEFIISTGSGGLRAPRRRCDNCKAPGKHVRKNIILCCRLASSKGNAEEEEALG